MRATAEELTNLLQMQQIDLELLKEKKMLEELPQRSVILAARQKKQSIRQKHDQVAELRAQAEAKVSKLEEEDAQLVEKQHRVQEAVEAARGDYRSVEAHTKELNGFAKRRATLEENLTKLSEELEKIQGVQDQVARALAEIEKQESEAVSSFQQEGGALQARISQGTAEREALSAKLTDEVRDIYEQVAARLGGVAVGRLMDGRCGACRAVIDGGRLIDLKAQMPLGTCPHCKRLLIVL